ncbi:MAG: outer membrane beta-barrel protein [Nitrospinota bacterium]|nr:outer membrane beta-barrel protein [Nitrospinota bacterium]
MMKRLLAVAVWVALGVWCSLANAQEGVDIQAETQMQIPEVTSGQGFYVGGHLGINAAKDSEINGGLLEAEHNALVGFGGFLGYDFGIFRMDGEIALRLSTTDRLGTLSLEPEGLFSSNESTTTAFSYMINGYFDLQAPDSPVSFFAGGGLGMATVSIDWASPGFFPFSEVTVSDDSDTALAYQFSLGFGYEINPRVTMTFTFRHFATEQLQMQFAPTSPIDPGLPFTMKYESNEFNIGARILFN